MTNATGTQEDLVKILLNVWVLTLNPAVTAIWERKPERVIRLSVAGVLGELVREAGLARQGKLNLAATVAHKPVLLPAHGEPLAQDKLALQQLNPPKTKIAAHADLAID